jgi:hypothetical protein
MTQRRRIKVCAILSMISNSPAVNRGRLSIIVTRISPFWAIRRNALASAVGGSGGFRDPALTAAPSRLLSAPLFVIGLSEDPDSLGHANSPSEVFDLNTAFDTGAAFSNRFFGSGRE